MPPVRPDLRQPGGVQPVRPALGARDVPHRPGAGDRGDGLRPAGPRAAHRRHGPGHGLRPPGLARLRDDLRPAPVRPPEPAPRGRVVIGLPERRARAAGTASLPRRTVRGSIPSRSGEAAWGGRRRWTSEGGEGGASGASGIPGGARRAGGSCSERGRRCSGGPGRLRAGRGVRRSPAPAAPGGTIKMAYRLRSPHTEVYGAIGDGFRQQHPSVTLVNEPVPGDFGLKVLELFASGSEPDTFWAEVGLFPGYVHKKMTLSLEQYARRDAKAVQLDDVFPGVLDQARAKGVLYGVPGDGGGPLVIWNAGMLQRAGLPAPGQLNESGQWTVERFLDIAKRSVRKGTGQPDVWGAEGHFAAYALWLAWVYGWGGDVFNKEGTAIVLDQPAAVEALQWLQDLSLRQGVSPTASEAAELRSAQLADRRVLFAAERVAMLTDYTTALGAGGILEAEKRGLRLGRHAPARQAKAGQFSVAQFHPFVASSSSKAPEARLAPARLPVRPPGDAPESPRRQLPALPQVHLHGPGVPQNAAPLLRPARWRSWGGSPARCPRPWSRTSSAPCSARRSGPSATARSPPWTRRGRSSSVASPSSSPPELPPASPRARTTTRLTTAGRRSTRAPAYDRDSPRRRPPHHPRPGPPLLRLLRHPPLERLPAPLRLPAERLPRAPAPARRAGDRRRRRPPRPAGRPLRRRALPGPDHHERLEPPARGHAALAPQRPGDAPRLQRPGRARRLLPPRDPGRRQRRAAHRALPARDRRRAPGRGPRPGAGLRPPAHPAPRGGVRRRARPHRRRRWPRTTTACGGSTSRPARRPSSSPTPGPWPAPRPLPWGGRSPSSSTTPSTARTGPASSASCATSTKPGPWTPPSTPPARTAPACAASSPGGSASRTSTGSIRRRRW